MLVAAHRFIELNRRLGGANTLTPGDIVDLAAFYGAGFPNGVRQNSALRQVLRQLDLPVRDFARDLHRVKALYDLLGGPKGGRRPRADDPSFPSPDGPSVRAGELEREGALQRKSTIFACGPDGREP